MNEIAESNGLQSGSQRPTSRAALLALPARLGLDVVIATRPENFCYATMLDAITFELIHSRLPFAILPAAGQPALVICGIELPHARQDGWIEDITTYTEFVDEPTSLLAGKLEQMGLAKARIGMDLDFLPARSFGLLRERLPEAEFVNTDYAIAAVRAIKDVAEIGAMERACHITHRAILDGIAASAVGDTERAIANRIHHNAMLGGADLFRFFYLGAGERGKLIHPIPTDRAPIEGEVLRMDIGGRFGAASSDFARTFAVGTPTAMQRDVYRGLRNVQAAVIGLIGPHMTAEDVFYACRDEFAKQGLNFRVPHVGHSHGIELHEMPLLRPGDKTGLEIGMTLNIEPLVYDDLGAIYHLEDLVEITASGSRLLSLGLAPPEMPSLGHR
jgi:Xaa-Pro dipeptidase